MINITLGLMSKAHANQPHQAPEATWRLTPPQHDSDVGWTGTMLACWGREGHS